MKAELGRVSNSARKLFQRSSHSLANECGVDNEEDFYLLHEIEEIAKEKDTHKKVYFEKELIDEYEIFLSHLLNHKNEEQGFVFYHEREKRVYVTFEAVQQELQTLFGKNLELEDVETFLLKVNNYTALRIGLKLFYSKFFESKFWVDDNSKKYEAKITFIIIRDSILDMFKNELHRMKNGELILEDF